MLVSRDATIADAELLFRWRTDPTTRQQSLREEAFSYESHVQWLTQALRDPKRKILIFEAGGKPVGMGRADRKEGHCELSWIVGPEARGQHYSYPLVAELVKRFHPATARIKPGNAASIKAAERAGLVRDQAVSDDDSVALLYTSKPITR